MSNVSGRLPVLRSLTWWPSLDPWTQVCSCFDASDVCWERHAEGAALYLHLQYLAYCCFSQRLVGGSWMSSS